MGLWRTTKNPSGFEVNIDQENIESMKREGASFCWMSDNVGINDENNKNYWEDDTTDEKEGNEIHKRLKEGIQIVDSDGKTITGYVSHMVSGPCFGTPLRDWFIIQPGSYPTTYTCYKDVSSNDVVITDL